MDIKEFSKDNENLMLEDLKRITVIPSPTGNEGKRAQYIKEYLINLGAKKVTIDEAKNCIFELNCENSNEITVFAAHTDTVFPDLEGLEVIEKDGFLHCPGVGDDTSGVVILIYLAKYFIENNIIPKNGIMFVFNSCEEGLGNLKGTKNIFKNYSGRIKEFISLDNSPLFACYNECVGSHRYKVSVKTQGGHSLENFGNTNAIFELSKAINKIYSIEIPKKDNTVTTYNVGMISAGTSINTIPQYAEMFCEYRSNDMECLSIMKEKFNKIFSEIDGDGVKAQVELIGDRPCGTAEMKEKSKYLCDILETAVFETIQKDVVYEMGSTDSNVPISLGIPSVTIGSFEGYGVHTREEYMNPDSLKYGLEIAIKFATKLLAEN